MSNESLKGIVFWVSVIILQIAITFFLIKVLGEWALILWWVLFLIGFNFLYKYFNKASTK